MHIKSRHAFIRNYKVITLAVLSTIIPVYSVAQQTPVQQVAPVDVIGDREVVPITRVTQDIEASPASVTVLGRRELERTPITTYGDVFRRVTGAFVNDYSQGLVAYEVKFRGFNSGHGRDVAFMLDGVPLNITGSQHTNGYADLAQIISEIVNRVEIVRGPFSIYAGNHAVGGSVNFYTDRNPGTSVKLDVDNFGRVRALPIYSAQAGPGSLLVALDSTTGDGYHRQSDLTRNNLFVRYSYPVAGGQAAFRFQAYDADADAPGYIDYAQVLSGKISPRDGIAKGVGDEKRQQNLVFNYRSDDAEGTTGLASGWQASAYAVNDDRRRFTFFDLSVPVNSQNVTLGGEKDKLKQFGFDLRKATMLNSGSLPIQLVTGLQYNSENIEALHFAADTSRRNLGESSTDTDRDVETRTTSLYAQVQISPIKPLKLTVGGRYDRIDFDINLNPLDDAFNQLPRNSFTDNKSRFSPKLGAALNLMESGYRIDAFVNYAQGLKSPYTFGDFNRLPSTRISPLRSSEVGLQGGDTQGIFSWRASVWQTRQTREALFDAANRFIGDQRTKRDGFDLEGRYFATKEIELYANYSKVRARIQDQPGNSFISDVPEYTATLGVDSKWQCGLGGLDVGLSSEFVGRKPILSDGSVKTTPYVRSQAKVALSPSALKNLKVALALTHYSNEFQETLFDFGGGQFGVSAKPKWKGLLSAQYRF